MGSFDVTQEGYTYFHRRYQELFYRNTKPLAYQQGKTRDSNNYLFFLFLGKCESVSVQDHLSRIQNHLCMSRGSRAIWNKKIENKGTFNSWVYVCVWVWQSSCTYHTCKLRIQRVYIYTYIYVYVCTHIRMYTCTCIHIYRHIKNMDIYVYI